MAERMSQPAVDIGVAEALAREEARIAEHWVWYLLLGIVLFVAGLAAIAFPLVSTIAAKLALGWIFLISGVAMIIHGFYAGEWRGFFYNLLLGALYVLAGAYLAFLPLSGIITLTVFVAALFILDGVLETIMAFRLRPHEGWGWVLVSGLVALAAGVLIAMQLPSSATWVIGVIAGIKLIFAGWSFMGLALSGQRSHPSAAVRA